MSEKNKATLEAANAVVAEGNYEGFLSFCANGTRRTFVGNKNPKGNSVYQ